MTKAEYLRLLQEKLESFNRELQSEIMEDYEQHFAEGLAEGKSEEEIIEELGNIEDMIRELPEEEIRQEIAVEEPEDFREDCEMDPEAERSGVFGGEYRGVVIDGLVADARRMEEFMWITAMTETGFGIAFSSMSRTAFSMRE